MPVMSHFRPEILTFRATGTLPPKLSKYTAFCRACDQVCLRSVNEKSLGWKPHTDSKTKRAKDVIIPKPKPSQRLQGNNACRSLVRPCLECASPVWDPHTKTETNKEAFVKHEQTPTAQKLEGVCFLCILNIFSMKAVFWPI